MIITSRSAVSTFQQCPRRRYWMYEGVNGTPTAGWERRKLAIPLVTGIYVHEGLEKALNGMAPTEAAGSARSAYLEEVTARGLAVEEGTDEGSVVEEQAAHVEALVLAWCRVRLPRWLDEYEVVEVEVEDRVPLSEDVTLAVRADAVVRRKADHRMFVINFKTVGQADDRWLRQWEVDMQLMTELLAAERRHGGTFGGVIIEGLVKGPRVGVDQWLKEVRGEDKATNLHHYADRSRLLYGYKADADPPLIPTTMYQSEGTTRKGWKKFATWQENFGQPAGMSALDYWINWLPEEVVEGCFVIVPPIMRDADRIEAKVRQIVTIERMVHANRIQLDTAENTHLISIGEETGSLLDERFPQNERSCVYPSVCPCWDLCYTGNCAEDPAGSGLYQARVDHHGPVSGGE